MFDENGKALHWVLYCPSRAPSISFLWFKVTSCQLVFCTPTTLIL